MSRSGAGAVACLLATALLITGCGGDGEQPGPTPEGGQAEAAEAEVQPLAYLKVTLYFPSADANRLVKESREIFETASPGDRAKQILSDLLEGPNGRGALPIATRGVRLRQVYVTAAGIAFADFSSDLRSAIRGGSTDEILTVYSIVNSLVLNIDEINKVAILVEGEECETLSGHMDLRRPLPANRRLLR